MSIWDDAPPPPAKRERAGGSVVLVVVLLLALLVGGGYAAAYVVSGDKVPRGTTVAGVDIGGRTHDAAVAALEEGLGDRADRLIPVSIDGDVQQVAPDNAGLAVDYAASVDEAGGAKSWRPDRLWDYFTGGDDLDPVVTVDETAMSTLVDELAQGLGASPRDAAVRFVDGGTKVRKARAGAGLDPTATRDALLAAYLTDETAELTTTQVQPDIDDDDAQDALDDFANPALSSPVRLLFGDSPVRLSPSDYGDTLSLEPEGGKLVPAVDEDALARLVGDVTSDSGAPVDATVRLVKGKPRVIPARPGVSYDPAAVTKAFLELVTRPEGERELEVEATVDDADFTTKDARKLRIRENVGEFTTYFPYAEYRNTNIGRAGELIDGTVLKPGETFSLNDTSGERTRENGFTEGFIISNGIFARTSAEVSRRWRPRRSTRCSSRGSRTSSTSRTRSTSTATPSAARPRSRSARSTCASATTPSTACSSTPRSRRARRRPRAW